MGMFSWNCKVCGHPALCEAATDKGINDWMTQVVVLGAVLLEGRYDGYGRVRNEGGVHPLDDEPCLYHKACWQVAGKPAQDGVPSPSARDQGWFFEEGAHDMLEPGVMHSPDALDKGLRARAERLRKERNTKALSMSEMRKEVPWEARFSVTPRNQGLLGGFLLCDALDGKWYSHDTREKAVAQAESLWADFLSTEVPTILSEQKEHISN